MLKPVMFPRFQDALQRFCEHRRQLQNGTSRTTARRYLEYLTAAGQLTAELI